MKTWLFTIAIVLGSCGSASAQAFVSPLLGSNFAGDARCPTLTGCQDKSLNVGVALGRMGNVLGFEEEFSYAGDFFGEAPGLSSSVLTIMSNVMMVPNVGPARPYVLAGIGLIKTRVELTPSSVFATGDTGLGWDLGGGVAILFGRHIGLRGDIRHFHAFRNLGILTFALTETKLDFSRGSAALIFIF